MESAVNPTQMARGCDGKPEPALKEPFRKMALLLRGIESSQLAPRYVLFLVLIMIAGWNGDNGFATPAQTVSNAADSRAIRSAGISMSQGPRRIAPGAWPIKASSNHRYLVTQDGSRWLMLASSPQPMLAYLTPDQMGTYMADRKSYGFNSIWFDALLGAYDGGYSDARLLDGTVPFTTGKTENNYDFSTPNEAYWAEIDHIVTQAAGYGLVAILDPFDTGLTPSTGDCAGKGAAGLADCRQTERCQENV